jgi:hypothetical protein
MLWKVLEKYGCPKKFISVIRSFHDGMMAQVTLCGDNSEPFEVGVGVRQGCVLAPVLFNMFLAAATQLYHGAIGQEDGIDISYRLDGSVFNLRRLQARTRTQVDKLLELQYADDCALVAEDPESLQRVLSMVQVVYEQLGLVINTDKTEILYQWNRRPENQPAVSISGVPLKVVPHFKYLGSLLSEDCTIDQEIQSRVNKASAAFARLRNRALQNRNLRVETRVAVYKAVCISTLLFGCEAWTLYRKHIKMLEMFHIKCIRRILGLTGQDRVPFTEILERAGITSVECMLVKHQLRWTGHLVRMPDHRIPKKVMYGQLRRGDRKSGGQKKRYKDNLKINLKNFNMEPDRLEAAAADRVGWRSSVSRGAVHFEQHRMQEMRERRARRRQRVGQPIPYAPDLVCPECGRQCASRIGLFSHRRSHRRQPV